MAEKGAYLTGTAFIKPSIFEIVAQESFAAILEPATKKVFTFLLSCNPERYGHLLKWVDECYLAFNVILQRYYIKTYSASFSETFYGLKRIALQNGNFKREMSIRQQFLSVMLTALFPYIKKKLHDLREKYKLEEVDGRAPENEWEKLYRKYFNKGCTISFILYETLVLYTYVLYISGKSMYPTPLLRLLSVTLTYAQPQNVLSVSDLLRKIKYNSFGTSDSIEIVQRLATRSLEFGAFFLQFLAWWNEGDHYSNITSLPVPPPPKVPEEARQYKGICPVCRKAPHILTVLSVSGYAYCYQCILSEVRKNGRCPVTRYPAKEDDIIRLYAD